jgi:hypothetical protein
MIDERLVTPSTVTDHSIALQVQMRSTLEAHIIMARWAYDMVTAGRLLYIRIAMTTRLTKFLYHPFTLLDFDRGTVVLNIFPAWNITMSITVKRTKCMSTVLTRQWRRILIITAFCCNKGIVVIINIAAIADIVSSNRFLTICTWNQ